MTKQKIVFGAIFNLEGIYDKFDKFKVSARVIRKIKE